jgi:hypothetical protein
MRAALQFNHLKTADSKIRIKHNKKKPLKGKMTQRRGVMKNEKMMMERLETQRWQTISQ